MKETRYLSYRRLIGDKRITITYREIGLMNLRSTKEKILIEKTEEITTYINYI
jgi:hypothetical protein